MERGEGLSAGQKAFKDLRKKIGPPESAPPDSEVDAGAEESETKRALAEVKKLRPKSDAEEFPN